MTSGAVLRSLIFLRASRGPVDICDSLKIETHTNIREARKHSLKNSLEGWTIYKVKFKIFKYRK